MRYRLPSFAATVSDRLHFRRERFLVNRPAIPATLFLAALASACSSSPSNDAAVGAEELREANSAPPPASTWLPPIVTVTATPMVKTPAHKVTAVASTTSAAGAHGDVRVGVCSVKDENGVLQDDTGGLGTHVALPLADSSVTLTNPSDSDLLLRFGAYPAKFPGGVLENNFPINIDTSLEYATEASDHVALLPAHGSIALNVGAHRQAPAGRLATIDVNCAPRRAFEAAIHKTFHYSGAVAYEVGARDTSTVVSR